MTKPGVEQPTERPPGSEQPDTSAQSGITQQALGGMTWLFSGAGARGVLNLLLMAVLARLLTPREFGLMGAAGVVTWFALIFADLGVAKALVQRRELELRHVSTGFTSTVVSGVLLAVLIWFGAPLLSDFFRMEDLTPIVRGLALVFPVTALSVVAEALLQRELRFQAITQAEVIAHVLGYSTVAVAMALQGFGVWALVGAHVGQALVKSALLLRAKTHSLSWQFEFRAYKELLYFGGGHTAGRLSTYFAVQGDNMVVGRWLGATALGLYGRAYSLMVLPAKAVSAVLIRVLFPAMSKIQHDRDRLTTAYRRGVAVTALVFLPASAVAIVLAPELVRVMLGPQWDGVVLPFRILAVGMYFRIGYMVAGSVAQATGAVYRSAWRQGLYAVLVGVGAVIGQSWGLGGVATGVLIAVAANFLMSAQLADQLTVLGWKAFGLVHLPALLLTAVLGLVALGSGTLLRSLDVPPLAILLGIGLLILIALVAIVRLFPRRALGADGVWMLQLVLTRLPPRMRFLIRLLSVS